MHASYRSLVCLLVITLTKKSIITAALYVCVASVYSAARQATVCESTVWFAAFSLCVAASEALCRLTDHASVITTGYLYAGHTWCVHNGTESGLT